MFRAAQAWYSHALSKGWQWRSAAAFAEHYLPSTPPRYSAFCSLQIDLLWVVADSQPSNN